jgi:hypothetical protein
LILLVWMLSEPGGANEAFLEHLRQPKKMARDVPIFFVQLPFGNFSLILPRLIRAQETVKTTC